jgi:hypothetical protein
MSVFEGLLWALSWVVFVLAGFAVGRMVESRRTPGRPSAGEYEMRAIVEEAEVETGVRLTWAGREMLVIPLIEVAAAGGPFRYGEASASVRDVLESIRELTRSTPLHEGLRDSIDVIAGFHRRFCNIPPFCSGKRGDFE